MARAVSLLLWLAEVMSWEDVTSLSFFCTIFFSWNNFFFVEVNPKIRMKEKNAMYILVIDAHSDGPQVTELESKKEQSDRIAFPDSRHGSCS